MSHPVGAGAIPALATIARDELCRSADVRAELVLDALVVMPNHIPGIVFIDGQKGDPPVALCGCGRDGVATGLP